MQSSQPPCALGLGEAAPRAQGEGREQYQCAYCECDHITIFTGAYCVIFPSPTPGLSSGICFGLLYLILLLSIGCSIPAV